MKKKVVFGVLLALVVSCISVRTNQAEEVDFIVSASLPAATGVSILATQVDESTGEFQNAVTALNFNPMTFDAGNGTWLPDHYFAIDIAAVDGIGSPDVTVKYTEGSKPAAQVKGLGFKALATFIKVTGGPSPSDQTETDLVSHGPKQLLKDLVDGEAITKAELEGGFLRVYIGVFPGGDTAIEAAGGEPFTNADKPGVYDGTVTITATVI
ncbi:hypothetical protein MNBD_UNCLBAC01-329 [hydrothermal vent metagenome]|uniref:Uncharacterized protein n=1 Tax=hydrothermal vent metagenome TaxID=652676 RepID=A0A3B1E1Y9_9ZZZZ